MDATGRDTAAAGGDVAFGAHTAENPGNPEAGAGARYVPEAAVEAAAVEARGLDALKGAPPIGRSSYRNRAVELIRALANVRSGNGIGAHARNAARLAGFGLASAAALDVVTPAVVATLAALKADFVTSSTVMRDYVANHLLDGWEYVAAIDQPGIEAVVQASTCLTALALALLLVRLVLEWRKCQMRTMFGNPVPADRRAKPLVETNHVVLAATTRTWDPRKPLKHAGLVLGYSQLLHRYYLSGEKAHTQTVAPPGVGKTTRMVYATIQAVLASEDSAVIVDPKGELFDNTYGAACDACGRDRVYVVDYYRWRRSDLYNLMSDVSRAYFGGMEAYDAVLARAAKAQLSGDGEGAARLKLEARNHRLDALSGAETRARDLATAMIPDLPNSSDNFWRPSARTLLTAMVLLVGTYRQRDWVDDSRMRAPAEPDLRQRSLKSVRAILNAMGKSYVGKDEGGRQEERLPLEDLFAGLDQEHPAARAFTQARNSKGQTLAGICSTLLNVLDAIITEESNMMSYDTDFDLDALGVDKTVIYFIVPEAQPAKYAYLPVFITQAYQACARCAGAHGGEMPRNVHFLMEEFGNSPQVPRFANMVNAGRGYGCRFHAIMQNGAQWDVNYGHDVATSIKDSLTCSNYLKVTNAREAKELSDAIGSAMVRKHESSASSQPGDVVGSGVSESVRLVSEPYVTPDQVLNWNPLWGSFVRRAELDRSGKLNKLLFHRDRPVVALYPTARPQHLPSLAAFGLTDREGAAERARERQGIDRTGERAVIPPWLAGAPDADRQEGERREMEPGAMDAATARDFASALVRERDEADPDIRAARDAGAERGREAAKAGLLEGETREGAVTRIYREEKREVNNRLKVARRIVASMEASTERRDPAAFADLACEQGARQQRCKDAYMASFRKALGDALP